MTRWFVVLLVLVGAGYALKRWSGGPAPAGPGSAPHRVSYELRWALGGAAAREQGFVIERADGRVEVDALAVVTISMSLVPCAPPKPPTALWDAVIPVARAGHSIAPDPAQLEAPVVDAYGAESSLSFGSRDLAGNRYCKVHWLVARGPGRGPHDLSRAGWAGQSLRVSGRFVPRKGAPVPFEWQTGLANGAFRDLPALPDAGALTVRLIRRVDTLFDGVDFMALPGPGPDIRPRKVLSNLFLATTLEAVSG